MTIQESEVQPSMVMQISTGKHRAICTALNIPVETEGDAILDLMLDKISLYDIYHRGIGWIEKQLFTHDVKKKGKQKT